MKITTVGIDLAKSVFQVHGVDEQGYTPLRRVTDRHIGAGSWTMAADGMRVAPTDETYGNLPYNFPKEKQRHARSQHHRPA